MQLVLKQSLPNRNPPPATAMRGNIWVRALPSCFLRNFVPCFLGFFENNLNTLEKIPALLTRGLIVGLLTISTVDVFTENKRNTNLGWCL